MDDEAQLVLEGLKEARSILSVPRNWASGKWAVDTYDADGEYVQQVCALGALGRVMHANPHYYATTDTIEEDLLDGAAFKLSGRRSIVDLNDAVGREAVLECYDAAICVLEKCDTVWEAIEAVRRAQ